MKYPIASPWRLAGWFGPRFCNALFALAEGALSRLRRLRERVIPLQLWDWTTPRREDKRRTRLTVEALEGRVTPAILESLRPLLQARGQPSRLLKWC
jgi:hypothetical protein